MFNAILIERDDRPYRATLTQLEEGRLPAAEFRQPGVGPRARRLSSASRGELTTGA